VSDRLEDLSLAQLAGMVRSGESSSVHIVSSFLNRIEQVDEDIRAWAYVNSERALNEAVRCDNECGRGSFRGPLHGIPVGIKDIFDTEGIPTRMGSPLFEQNVPNQDAVAVRRLKEAGAIILGKLATSEFAALDPGPTRNPWNLEHTPGGSSSGSGAAVAASMCPAATGTQTAGSIGRPAAFCGVVGLMPTAARISRDGVFPAAWSLDHVGAFGRSVDDVALMFGAMSGEMSGEMSGAISGALSGTTLAMDRAPKKLRIGFVREFFEEHTTDAAWSLHEVFAQSLTEKRGFEVIPLSLPAGFSSALPALWTIMRSELAAVHGDRFARHSDGYGSRIREFVQDGLTIKATEYVRARRLRRNYKTSMLGLFDDCDVILSPGAPGPAPLGLETTGDPILSAPWTLADFPTLSLPVTTDDDGMPIGIQLSVKPFAEAFLLLAGRQIEQLLPATTHPPIPSRR
jgi:Asp-tRNA(Asn)/Glu-tRNA(Gln) amidotransferase A subunit family amidase